MNESDSASTQYEEGSLSLTGSVAMGTGVMIGAGIFALTGQVAEQAGGLFPLAFLSAALVAAFSAYSYVKMARSYPSAGGIAMFLMKAYGKGTMTAGFSLLMYISMVINESLVARTFGTYVLQLFDGESKQYLVPALGVGLLVAAFIVNILGNRFIDTLSTVTAVIKIAGIILFAVAGLWVSGLTFESVGVTDRSSTGGFLSATALALLLGAAPSFRPARQHSETHVGLHRSARHHADDSVRPVSHRVAGSDFLPRDGHCRSLGRAQTRQGRRESSAVGARDGNRFGRCHLGGISVDKGDQRYTCDMGLLGRNSCHLRGRTTVSDLEGR